MDKFYTRIESRQDFGPLIGGTWCQPSYPCNWLALGELILTLVSTLNPSSELINASVLGKPLKSLSSWGCLSVSSVQVAHAVSYAVQYQWLLTCDASLLLPPPPPLFLSLSLTLSFSLSLSLSLSLSIYIYIYRVIIIALWLHGPRCQREAGVWRDGMGMSAWCICWWMPNISCSLS